MGRNFIDITLRFVELGAIETSKIFNRAQNNLRITLSRRPIIGLEIFLRLMSPFNVCPYKWNCEENLLILCRNTAQRARWNMWRKIHLFFSIFIISRSIWLLPGESILSQFISSLWVSIYVTGSWFNAFYLYKLHDVCGLVNGTFKVVFNYSPGGKHAKNIQIV